MKFETKVNWGCAFLGGLVFGIIGLFAGTYFVTEEVKWNCDNSGFVVLLGEGYHCERQWTRKDYD
jgi:hypothetical protein